PTWLPLTSNWRSIDPQPAGVSALGSSERPAEVTCHVPSNLPGTPRSPGGTVLPARGGGELSCAHPGSAIVATRLSMTRTLRLGGMSFLPREQIWRPASRAEFRHRAGEEC